MHTLRGVERGRRRHDHPDPAVQRPARRDRAVRRRSATSTAAAPSSRRCSPSSATRSRATTTGRAVGAHHAGAPRGVRRRPRRPRAGHARGAAPGDGHGRRRRRVLRVRATTRTSCCARCAAATCRSRHGLAESLAQLAAETDEFRAAVEQFLDGLISHYVLDGGRLVVSHAGLDRALPGPRVRPGARVLPVRPDHRRDRRVRPAGALPVGAGVPRPGDGALRPHAGAGRRSGSTTRCASTPGACSAAGSPRCATPSASSCPSRPPQVYYEPAKPFPANADAAAADAARARGARHHRRDRHAGDRDRLPAAASACARRTPPPRSR